MVYPLISEYTEAILSAEDNFNELSYLRPVLDDKGNPIMSSGNFAVVYKMVDVNTGKYHAVKCFTRDQENRPEAYKAISEYISQLYHHNYLINVNYIEDELFVDSSQTDKTEFPILLMDWVEGKGLEEYVFQYLDNEEKLEELYENFKKFVSWLLPSHFAHGDLKPDNLIITPKGEIVLIDYDGMYVPSMFGQVAPELGTPQFQFKGRTFKDFSEFVDDYASIFISLILRLIILTKNSIAHYLSLSSELLVSEAALLISDIELSKLLSLFLIVQLRGFIERDFLSNAMFDEDKYDRGRELSLINKSTMGNTQSMIRLGDTYSRGIFTPKNPYKALQWYLTAKNMGNVNASCGICRHFYHFENDFHGLKNFCKSPLHKSMRDNLIDFSLCREGEEHMWKDEEYSQKYFEKASKFNYAPAMYWSACHPLRDIDVNINLLLKACDLNYATAYRKLGYCYKNGKGVNKDSQLSLDYFKKAAELDDDDAQYKLAFAHYVGINNNPRSYEESIFWLTKAFEQGNIEATLLLAKCYLEGVGVPKNPQKAFQLYSILKNNDKALFYLSYLYETGIGTEKNINNAIKYARKAIFYGFDISDFEIHLRELYTNSNIPDELLPYENEIVYLDSSYSKDEKRLVEYREENYNTYEIKDGCEILCNYCFSEIYKSQDDSPELEKIIIPESVIRIGSNVFSPQIKDIENKSQLFTIEAGNLLSKDKRILYRYFGDPQDFKFLNEVKYLMGGSLSNILLSEIIIPESVKYMEGNPFKGTQKMSPPQFSQIKNIISKSPYFFIANESIYEKPKRKLVASFNHKFEFKVENGTFEVGENALWDVGFEEIYLPSSIKKIHFSAFYRCWNLKRIFIPKGTKEYFLQILPEYLLDNQELDIKQLTYCAPVPDQVEIREY